MVATRRRDWFWILRQLAKAGVSMAAVARKCNRNPTTVAEWANGSEPRESDGRIVLALLAKHNPDAYREHQKAFEIKVVIDEITEPGENLGLPFVE